MNKQVLQPSAQDKTVMSFLIAPAIPALITTIEFLTEYRTRSLLATSVIFVLVYLIATAHSFVLGIPTYLLFKRLNVIHWWTCILAGFLIGGLPIALWRGWSEAVRWGLLGTSTGFGFWLLWQFWIYSDQQQ